MYPNSLKSNSSKENLDILKMDDISLLVNNLESYL